jgi:hypothetical protein
MTWLKFKPDIYYTNMISKHSFLDLQTLRLTFLQLLYLFHMMASINPEYRIHVFVIQNLIFLTIVLTGLHYYQWLLFQACLCVVHFTLHY